MKASLMADLLKMDPARIARLRDPARLKQIDPATILDHVQPLADGPILDVGAGVGFVSLPFARLLPGRDIIACDIQAGMIELLTDDGAAEGLTNLKPTLMPGPSSLPVPDACAAMLVMLQVHHELDDAISLLRECHRVLQPGAPFVIVDWVAGDIPSMASGGRRVAAENIRQQVAETGFKDVTDHPVYTVHSMTVGIA
jgi:SAM-dependent methyltransferase